MFIDGEWCEARSGRRFEVTDPATTEVIGDAPDTAFLAVLDELVLGVAHLADGGAVVDEHAAHLGGGHTQGGEVALPRDQLHGDTRRTAELAALAGAQLDVVDGGTYRDVTLRERVAGVDVGADSSSSGCTAGTMNNGSSVSATRSA